MKEIIPCSALTKTVDPSFQTGSIFSVFTMVSAELKWPQMKKNAPGISNLGMDEVARLEKNKSLINNCNKVFQKLSVFFRVLSDVYIWAYFQHYRDCYSEAFKACAFAFISRNTILPDSLLQLETWGDARS